MIGELPVHAGRFALMITLDAHVNPDFGPHFNMAAGAATNTLMIAPDTKPTTTMRVMVIDTETDEIVFFDMNTTSNFDPRLKDDIEHITRSIIKKVYF